MPRRDKEKTGNWELGKGKQKQKQKQRICLSLVNRLTLDEATPGRSNEPEVRANILPKDFFFRPSSLFPLPYSLFPILYSLFRFTVY